MSKQNVVTLTDGQLEFLRVLLEDSIASWARLPRSDDRRDQVREQSLTLSVLMHPVVIDGGRTVEGKDEVEP
jgi:hypothetical protein